MGFSIEGSYSESREYAIETLIDMDPCGVAYRAAKTMNDGLNFCLQGRSNRISETALLHAANSLAHNEILPSSSEIMDDLFLPTESEIPADDSKLNEDQLDLKVTMQPIRIGWEDRVLSHHEKIIRAKNNMRVVNSGVADIKPLSSSTNSASAVPPPELITALRQVFGSTTSPDYQDLMLNKGDYHSDAFNSLPTLLQSVLTHTAFSGIPSFPYKSSLNQSNDSRSEVKVDEGESEKKTSKLMNDAREVTLTEVSPHKLEINSAVTSQQKVLAPSAANIETIIGNVCRGIISKTCSNNDHIQGLLIASLSVLTGSLMSEEDLENIQLNYDVNSQFKSPTRATFDSLNNTHDSKRLLNVGPLLFLLQNFSGTVYHEVNGMMEFFLNDRLLRYFAEASSIYEERIEMQKSILLSSIRKSNTTAELSGLKKTHLPVDSTSSPSLEAQDRMDSDRVKDDKIMTSNESLLECNITDDMGDQVLHNTDVSVEEVPSDEYIANITNLLLSNVRNIVADEAINYGEDVEDEVDRDGDEIESYVDSGDDDDDDSEENSEATREYAVQDNASNQSEVSNHDSEAQTTRRDLENDEEEESLMLQRALALSLAATVSAGASDSSNSDSSENESKVKTSTASSTQVKKLSSLELDVKISHENAQTKHQNAGDTETSIDLPSLPIPPPLSLLLRNFTVDEVSENDIKSILDPKTLILFGSVPASCVLAHLLQSVLSIMCNGSENSLKSNNRSHTVGSSSSSTTSISSHAKGSSRVHDKGTRLKEKQLENTFIPDSVTAQLLIALLYLSSSLRSSAISAMRDILSDGKDEDKNVTEGRDMKEQIIQIENSEECEDPLFEKEDPASFEVTAQSLDSKGLKRKAAAAVDIAVMRYITKQKFARMWRERASLYSYCCFLSMRCFRIFLAKCVQCRLQFSDGSDSEKENILNMPTKSRIELSTALSYFHSSSIPDFMQTLQHSMNQVLPSNETSSSLMYHQLLVSRLFSESLLLWGASISFLYPEHKKRIDQLHSLLQNIPSHQSIKILDCSTTSKVSEPERWNDYDLQIFKLDILCHRLRMSDMLDFFVAQPLLGVGDSSQKVKNTRLNINKEAPSNSLSTITLLGAVLEKNLSSLQKYPHNVSKLYFALCARSISNLILWNNLSLSMIDDNHKEGSLKLNLNPTSFRFDSLKCAESIAIDPLGVTANQRATKVWGTVLATTCFLPKSGVHRWAVKLDKCERGHVFVGVATARANVKTYVGGDKYGWGVIGTQALWHNRNKVRGDYGAIVRTGSVIVVTLDTNVGTLSFGLWKDTNAEVETGAVTPLVGLFPSPLRISAQGSGSGILVDDWGVAFEGLPLDVRLYPAVGLYQRDDRATLYTISNANITNGKSSTSLILSDGHSFTPGERYNCDDIIPVRSWNLKICADGISFASEILLKSIEILSSGTDFESSVLLSNILPSLASSLCMIPAYIPTISARYAMELLPLVTRSAKLLDSKVLPENRNCSLGITIEEGLWLFHIDFSTSSESESNSSSDVEEYIVELKCKPVQDLEIVDSLFHGKGESSTGRLLKGHVFLIGAVCGAHVQFVEEWYNDENLENEDVLLGSKVHKSTSSSVIDARLSLDGTKFEGYYHNVQKGISGHIVGFLKGEITGPVSQNVKHASYKSKMNQINIIHTESLLCLAAGHLSLVLCSQTALSDIENFEDLPNEVLEVRKKQEEMFQTLLMSSPILSNGKLDDGNCIRSSIDAVCKRCRALERRDCKGPPDFIEHWQNLVHFNLFKTGDKSFSEIAAQRLFIKEAVQSHFSSNSQYNGSFSRFCPLDYEKSCKMIASVILYHCGTHDSDVVASACAVSRKILEDGIRNALIDAQACLYSKKDICQQRCSLSVSISEFLFQYASVIEDNRLPESVMDEISFIFKSIQSKEDLNQLKQVISLRTEKCIMRYVGLRAMQLLLESEDDLPGINMLPAVESVIVSCHRLFSTSISQVVPSMNAGCLARVQLCMKVSTTSLYSQIESTLTKVLKEKSFRLTLHASLVLAAFTNFFIPFDPSRTTLEIFKLVISHCSYLAFSPVDLSSSESTLLNSIRIHCAQRLLKVTASALLTTATFLSERNLFEESLVGLLSDTLLQEIMKVFSTTEEQIKTKRSFAEEEAVRLDWNGHQSYLELSENTQHSISTHSNSGVAFFIKHTSLLPTKSGMLMVLVYDQTKFLDQLLDSLHSIIQSKFLPHFLKVIPDDLTSTLLIAACSELPLNCRLRILRLLRPVLLKMEGNSKIVENLFRISGISGQDYDNVNETNMERESYQSSEALALSQGAVALLRYLYAFSAEGTHSWHKVINQVITSTASSSFISGILSFFGGVPGCIQNGSFVLIDSEQSSSLYSSSSISVGKLRGEMTKTAPVGTGNSAGRGLERIKTGLCRHSAHAGILCSVDSKAGMCEIIVMSSRCQVFHPDCLAATSVDKFKIIGRAIRVNSANIAAVDELPLVMRHDLPVRKILLLLLHVLNSSTSLIHADKVQTVAVASQEAPKSFVNNAQTRKLLLSAMGLRALTVLLSDPKLLYQKLTLEELTEMHNFLSLALQLANSKSSIKSLEGLSSLPRCEARIRHLFLIGSMVESRRHRLLHLTENRLQDMLDKELLVRKSISSPISSSAETSGYHTSSSVAVSLSGLSTENANEIAIDTAPIREERAVSSHNDDDDNESQIASATLREAAIVQMIELGLPRQWAELALRRTGDIDAAVHFCLERGVDMERLIAEEERIRGTSSILSSSRRGFGLSSRMTASNLIPQLVEMGFPRHWCATALAATSNNVDQALTWILNNSERLSTEGGRVEEENNENNNQDEVEDSDHDSDEGSFDRDNSNISTENSPNETVEMLSVLGKKPVKGWSTSIICPLRFISGRCKINPLTLEVGGLKDGGFSSVGTKGVLVTSGKWYYEAEILSPGCIQIGWADSSFAGHCQADRGDGCGDGPSSWAFDGWRRYRWHSTATEWGCRWAEGDIIGCLVDMDDMKISFTLNGRGEEIGMGLAFSEEGFRPCSGVYACVSFNRREKVRLILGGEGTEAFNFPPPEGYNGIGEAIINAVKERSIILKEEEKLGIPKKVSPKVSFPTHDKLCYLCDFSDGEHGHELFSWQHRYHGSDASVHLGGNRSTLRLAVGGRKSLKSGLRFHNNSNLAASVDIFNRLSKAFEHYRSIVKSEKVDSDNVKTKLCLLENVYSSVLSAVDNELTEVFTTLSILYAQKLVMHVLISYSHQFSPKLFLPLSPNADSFNPNLSEDIVSRQLWGVIEQNASFSHWLGEAGTMALAAEALGLGVSTFDSNTSDFTFVGMCDIGHNSEEVVVCGGYTQFLSSAVLPFDCNIDGDAISTNMTFASCAEAAIGSDSGGVLSFLRFGLQNALATSCSFRQIILAGIRRGLRILAVVEYRTEDGVTEEESTDFVAIESNSPLQADKLMEYSPDARLVSFMTGVLLSENVRKQLSESEDIAIRSNLFEAWSVGLLSASSPWRMICALTAAGILNTCPIAVFHAASRVSAIAKYFGRLENICHRRLWSERAAFPVCSRYSQALIELLSSVKRSYRLYSGTSMSLILSNTRVDAATPIPFTPSCKRSKAVLDVDSWEWADGWISSDNGWVVWTGTVEIMEVEWKTPPRSIVRSYMDGGEGPPFFGEGCLVLRGPDWCNRDNIGNEDGGDLYEKEKLSQEAVKPAEVHCSYHEQEENKTYTKCNDPALEDEPSVDVSKIIADRCPDMAALEDIGVTDDPAVSKPNKYEKKRKISKMKLPLGTVVSVEPWKGVPAMARRVRWHLTGEEGVYRYGGDGGRFDIIHVESNDKETRIRKRHHLPESIEQCASRNGFGQSKIYNVILRFYRPINGNIDASESFECDGILEWPDFGAGIKVKCAFYSDGAVSVSEEKILYGSKDSGWEARFGQPSFVPGTVTVISPTHDDILSSHEILLGSSSFLVKDLRNKENHGSHLRVTSEMRLLRTKPGKLKSEEIKAHNPQISRVISLPSQPPPICFDSDFHAPSLTLSRDKRTVTCLTSEGRGTAFGNVGFVTGVHYWEVKIEKAEVGSVFIGVAEKPGSATSSSQGFSYNGDNKPRLNKWLGWGFVNFRATYTAGAERVFGAHCHAGDTVGVMLDCNSGRISFFFDGVKYGEHILNDLGCAFENVSPFGFNADGCGSGGAAQGAPSGIDNGRSGRYPSNGIVRPRALWPVIGLRHPGDRVTMSSKWLTSRGVDGVTVLKNILAVDEVLCIYEEHNVLSRRTDNNLLGGSMPLWFVEETFLEYNRWRSEKWLRTSTRGSGPYRLSSIGLDVDLDTTPFSCAAACASLGLSIALLPGDRVNVTRSTGRILDLQEEAVVLGSYQGLLFYCLVSQKSEGGSLMEGGGRAWFWDESEAVEGGLQLIGEGKGLSVELPKLQKFKPLIGGLKVVYVGGAVVQSDLEIFDGSTNVGTIPYGTFIPAERVIERRCNHCGVVRFLIDLESTGRGWISQRIRGGKEELIVEILPHSDLEGLKISPEYITSDESAREWYRNYQGTIEKKSYYKSRENFRELFDIDSIDDFSKLLQSGRIQGMSEIESDTLIAFTFGKVADILPHHNELNCPFTDCAIVLSNVSLSSTDKVEGFSIEHNVMAQGVASDCLHHLRDKLPSIKALMARISMLRALNRRAQFSLPWLSMKPAQEGSAVFGGLCGFGASLEHAGRSWNYESNCTWVQVSSISLRVRKCKGLIFPSVKRSFLDSVMDITATPTPLSHDEYELPREIRTVRINRLKAHRAMTCNDSTLKQKHSVFFQMQHEMRGWSGATLRRGFLAKGHGGQKRAFKVKLVGEGVNDYSGPYREVFTDAIKEVSYTDSHGHNSLRVLEATANNEADVGEDRDLFMFAQHSDETCGFVPDKMYENFLSPEEKEMLRSYSSLTHKSTETSHDIDDSILFLGKLAGTACRHNIPIDLPLPLGIVWGRLAEDSFDVAMVLKEVDILAYKLVQEDKDPTLADSVLLTQRRLMSIFAEGMSSVLPIELFSLFTGKQLRDLFCGNPLIDIELLHRVVEYEGYKESDLVIVNFWKVLQEMSTSECKLFLQFVWARNRLPLKESDFDSPFRIVRDSKETKIGEDYPLPSASTCFFSLMLPEYPTKSVLKQKLLYAIENVTTMESDYVTNDKEVSEGWNGL